MTDKRQMTIFEFLDPAEEKTEETKVDMSCFATRRSGEPWNVSVALAKEFFKIPTVPEYSVEYYRRRNKGAKH